jgi:hypothetical protein
MAKKPAHSRVRIQLSHQNGICERFHKTVLDEFYCLEFRKKLNASIEDLKNRP